MVPRVFFPQSKTDKVDTFGFSRNTTEIALPDWGTDGYQTAAGTGSSILHGATHAHFFLPVFPPFSLSLYSSSPGAALALCFLFKLICSPGDLSFFPSGPPFCPCLISHCSSFSPLYTGGLKEKGSKLTHKRARTHTHTHTTREQQVIPRLSAVHWSH